METDWFLFMVDTMSHVLENGVSKGLAIPCGCSIKAAFATILLDVLLQLFLSAHKY